MSKQSKLYLTKWPRTWKHGKPGKLWDFEKLSESQGKLKEILILWKNWKTQGKCKKKCDIISNENVFQRTFLSDISQGNIWKYPGNLRENLGNLVCQKCGHPDLTVYNILCYFDWLISSLGRLVGC